MPTLFGITSIKEDTSAQLSGRVQKLALHPPREASLTSKIQGRPNTHKYKSEHSDQNYIASCSSPSAIASCYQSLCFVQKLDQMYC